MTQAVNREDAKKLALYVLRAGQGSGAFRDKPTLEAKNKQDIGRVLFCLYLEYKDTSEFSRLIDSARHDPNAFDVIVATCVAFIENGAALPKTLRDWFSDYLKQEIERPSEENGKVGAKEKRTPQAATIIHAAVQAIVDVQHAKATRHSYNPPHSACDIVAEALAEINFPIKNFEDVKKIYTKINKETADWEKKYPHWTPKPVQHWRQGKPMFEDDDFPNLA